MTEEFMNFQTRCENVELLICSLRKLTRRVQRRESRVADVKVCQNRRKRRDASLTAPSMSGITGWNVSRSSSRTLSLNKSVVGRLIIDVIHGNDDRRLLLPVMSLDVYESTYLANDVVIPYVGYCDVDVGFNA